MSKNIVIFSDGTGQAGGLMPDQNLSNVYKLFRASRPGPESPTNPMHQVAAYDAGLGTENDEGKLPFRPIQKFRKLWSGSTGTGISRNIADCYLAILKHYEPGDRVFLFGFSRGAYTARCVGGVMSLCGVPTQKAGGGPLPRFGTDLRRIADEAVQQVYEHGSGSDKPERKAERLEKARRFREKYGCANVEGQANVVPYFIGAFDTVAALGAPGLRRWMMAGGLAAFAAAMIALAAGVLSLTPWFPFGSTFAAIVALTIVGMVASYARAHVKTITDFPNKGDFSWHIAAWRFRVYDLSLNPRVRYARHALAIDESREDFARVPWANLGTWPDRTGEPEWLQQVWFAGNHSDVGGSYPEDEARLSDISLKWMVDQATSLPHPLLVDPSRLHLFPDSAGMQHSEVESMRESYPSWWPKSWRWTWAQVPRDVNIEAPLHSTVFDRFAHERGVLHYGLRSPYRPANLREHTKLGRYYGCGTSLPVVAAVSPRQAQIQS
jgi:uncharacterized protein (DUF2235 family)